MASKQLERNAPMMMCQYSNGKRDLPVPPPGLSRPLRCFSSFGNNRSGSMGSPQQINDMKSLAQALVKCKEGSGEVERIICEAKFCPRLPGLTKLIGVLSKQHGAWRKALEIYHCVPSLGLKPDTALTNAAISACDRGGQWREALKLWFAMDQRDNISYSAMISALAKGRQWSLALEVFCYMIKAGCCPDVITCCSLIAALDKGNYWQLAERVFVLLWTEQLPAVERLMAMCCNNEKIEPLDLDALQALWHAQAPMAQHSFAPAAGSGGRAAGALTLWDWCHSVSPGFLAGEANQPATSLGTLWGQSLDHLGVDMRAPSEDFTNGFVPSTGRDISSRFLPNAGSGFSPPERQQTNMPAGAEHAHGTNRANVSHPNIWSSGSGANQHLLGFLTPPPQQQRDTSDYHLFGSSPENGHAQQYGTAMGSNLSSRFSLPDLHKYSLQADGNLPQPASAGSFQHGPDITGLLSSLSLSQNAGGDTEPKKAHLRSVSSASGLSRLHSAGNSLRFVNTICCNALLSAYANASPPQWERALLLLSSMQQQRSKIAADCVAYNTVMKACRAADRLDVAYKVFYYMLDAQVGPSVATFNTMISAAMNKQEYEMVVMLWRKVGEAGLTPSAACFNAVVIALQQLGMWEEAMAMSHSL